MRILALYPIAPESPVFERMPPLGMLWIAARLRSAGHEIEFIDAQVDETDPGTAAEAFRPALTLIGGTSHSRFASFDLARRIKQAWPVSTVIYGGPHASFTPEDTLSHVPEIDIVVRGEGEDACVDLAAWAALTDRDSSGLAGIPGLYYRENGGVHFTGERPPINDLDLLDPPARDLVPMKRYDMRMDFREEPGTSILTARGCPIACSFCSASAIFGSKYRMRSAARVVDEIEDLLRRYGFRGIKIFDSTFTLNRGHAESFCRELKRRGLRIPWECEIRVGSVDRPLLALMREAGCYYVDVGVESGSQRVLDQCVGKQIRLEDAERLLRWTNEEGILTKVFFTVGHPGESFGEALRTNWFARRHRGLIRVPAYQAGVKIYPGTEVERYARERKLLPDGFRWSAPYVNTANLRLFRPANNIPILIQPQLGVERLRMIQILFMMMQYRSPWALFKKLLQKARRRMGILLPFLVTVGMLLLVEGFSALLLRGLGRSQGPGARFATQDVWQHGADPFHEPDSELFWRLIPGYSRGPISINQHGCRGPDFLVPKPAGTYRIVLLGNSVTFGYGLPEESCFSGILREEFEQPRFRRLAHGRERIEVINAGVMGYSSLQGRFLYSREVRLWKPDLVIAMFGYNDHHTARESDLEKSAHRHRNAWLNLIQRTSTFRLAQRLSGHAAPFLRLEPVARVDLPAFQQNILSLRNMAAEGGAACMFLTIPLRPLVPLVESFCAVDSAGNKVWVRQIDFLVDRLMPECRDVLLQHFMGGGSLDAFVGKEENTVKVARLEKEYPYLPALCYLRARCLLGRGRTGEAESEAESEAERAAESEAEREVLKCRQLDHERQVMEGYNSLLRRLAQDSRIELIDLAQEFDARPGDSLFIDVVHPNPTGHALVAGAIATHLWKLSENN